MTLDSVYLCEITVVKTILFILAVTRTVLMYLWHFCTVDSDPF